MCKLAARKNILLPSVFSLAASPTEAGGSQRSWLAGVEAVEMHRDTRLGACSFGCLGVRARLCWCPSSEGLAMDMCTENTLQTVGGWGRGVEHHCVLTAFLCFSPSIFLTSLWETGSWLSLCWFVTVVLLRWPAWGRKRLLMLLLCRENQTRVGIGR